MGGGGRSPRGGRAHSRSAVRRTWTETVGHARVTATVPLRAPVDEREPRALPGVKPTCRRTRARRREDLVHAREHALLPGRAATSSSANAGGGSARPALRTRARARAARRRARRAGRCRRRRRARPRRAGVVADAYTPPGSETANAQYPAGACAGARARAARDARDRGAAVQRAPAARALRRTGRPSRRAQSPTAAAAAARRARGRRPRAPCRATLELRPQLAERARDRARARERRLRRRRERLAGRPIVPSWPAHTPAELEVLVRERLVATTTETASMSAAVGGRSKCSARPATTAAAASTRPRRP